MDKLTQYFSRALNIMFLYNVLGTSYGVLLGIFLLSLQDVIASFWPIVGLIKGYGFLALGVLLFNIKPMVEKKYVDPNIERQLRYIREMIKEAKFTEQEKRAIWRNAIYSIVADNDEGTDVTSNTNNSNTIISG